MSAGPSVASLRSYLYAPGSSARLLERVLHAGADAAVLDLEDAVPAGEKAAARTLVARRIEADAPDAPCEVHVRVNRAGAGYDADDLAAAVQPGLAALRLPKAEDPDVLRALDERLAVLEAGAGLAEGAVALYPIIESARGVWAAHALASASRRVARLAFGATDYLADIAATGAPDGPATWHARGHLVLASRVAGVAAPVDSVHTGVRDLDGLRTSARSARELGFFGKSIIHPAQVVPVHEVFTPTAAERDRAGRVLEALAAAERDGSAALVVDGEFVDAAVAARARHLLPSAKDRS
jgi:citrate lyase subunit beta / citryl-CoA lyase